MSEEIKFSQNTYCVTDVFIIRNYSSSIWNLVDKYSKQKWSTFAHDHIRYGVCVNTCKKELNQFELLASIRCEPRDLLENLPRYITDPSRYYGAAVDDIKYGSLIDKCINKRMKSMYGLQAVTKILYCDHKEDAKGFVGMEIGELFEICNVYDDLLQIVLMN